MLITSFSLSISGFLRNTLVHAPAYKESTLFKNFIMKSKIELNKL